MHWKQLQGWAIDSQLLRLLYLKALGVKKLSPLYPPAKSLSIVPGRASKQCKPPSRAELWLLVSCSPLFGKRQGSTASPSRRFRLLFLWLGFCRLNLEAGFIYMLQSLDFGWLFGLIYYYLLFYLFIYQIELNSVSLFDFLMENVQSFVYINNLFLVVFVVHATLF